MDLNRIGITAGVEFCFGSKLTRTTKGEGVVFSANRE